MVNASRMTCNDRTIRPTLSKVKIHDNYDRSNKIIVMPPPTILTVNKTKKNSTTIKMILKSQL